LLGVLFANNRHFRPNGEDCDYVHLNDIEELPVEFEDAFPSFDAGDLLVSLREPNMTMVINPKTEIVKWYQVGPWIQQHDTDFQENGTITLFDNAVDGTYDGRIFGGSKIISIDPMSRETKVLYKSRENELVYTRFQGDHQLLKNGNILITETDSGRIIEVDMNGYIVWEYINRYSVEEVYRVGDSIRYTTDYFTVETWVCN
jgi:hypothetical protein